jgi:hypothetical protein
VPHVTGDSRLQSDVLEDLSDAHRYRRWLADLARPYLGEHPIEIGSGTGRLRAGVGVHGDPIHGDRG